MPKINGKYFKWVVDPAPTGQWRAFEERKWPTLVASRGEYYVAGRIQSVMEYSPGNARRRDLSLKVIFHNWTDPCAMKPMVSRLRFSTLAEAKAYLEKLVETYPEAGYEPRKLLKGRI